MSTTQVVRAQPPGYLALRSRVHLQGHTGEQCKGGNMHKDNTVIAQHLPMELYSALYQLSKASLLSAKSKRVCLFGCCINKLPFDGDLVIIIVFRQV